MIYCRAINDQNKVQNGKDNQKEKPHIVQSGNPKINKIVCTMWPEQEWLARKKNQNLIKVKVEVGQRKWERVRAKIL